MKMTSRNFCKRLSHIAKNRISFYDNSYPGNCGLIRADGSISFDCIGLVKSLINEPDIAFKHSPAGYFVKPGQVIQDTNEIGILNLCENVRWYEFYNIQPGEYLYMNGHAGVYIGEYGDINCVECTAAWTGGVVFSYIDKSNGARYQHKGGPYGGYWEAHGKLSKYIDYKNDIPKKGETVTYQAYDINKSLWLPAVTSDTKVKDTAGLPCDFMGALAVKVSKGVVTYAVHNNHGEWLPPVSNYNIDDFHNGYAGVGNAIDAVAIYSDTVKLAYRVKLLVTQEWLPWVKSDDFNINDPENGYAGIMGHAIDEIEIRVI